jgi:glycosyltransferase involved in cell wall biosynthesis
MSNLPLLLVEDEPNLGETLRDYLRAKKFEVELILSNDGSLDDTIKIMHDCRSDFESQNLCIVKVLDFKHRGYIETLFDSYKKASNDIICNMEADCSILPENFEIFSNFICSFDIHMDSFSHNKSI